MTDLRRTGHDKDAVATWLREQAASRGAAVSSLLSAWEEGDASLTNHSTTDLETLLPFRPQSQGSTLVYAARNALIFLPILITWLSLAHAIEQFDLTMQLNPDKELTFLLFWQGLQGMAAFSAVAYADALLIIVTVLFSLVIALHYESPGRLDRLQRTHDDMLAAIEWRMAPLRNTSATQLEKVAADLTSSFSSRADTLLAELGRTSAAIDGIKTKIEEVTASASSSTVVLQGIVTDLVAPRAAELEHVVKELLAASKQHQSLATVVQTMQTSLAESAARLRETVDLGITKITESSQSQHDLASRFMESSMAAFSSRLLEQTTTVASTVTGILAALQGAAVQLDQGLGKIVSNSTNTAANATLRVDAAAEQLAQSILESSEALQTIARSAELTVVQVRNDMEAIRAASSRSDRPNRAS